jgi:hypothetical protein
LSLLADAFRRFKEHCELVQPSLAEGSELRHPRAGVGAGRALHLVDLELDAEVVRADRGLIRRARRLYA